MAGAGWILLSTGVAGMSDEWNLVPLYRTQIESGKLVKEDIMTYYIGWLSGHEDRQGASILRGSIEDINAKAREIADSDAWKQTQPAAYLTITEGARQKFVSKESL